MRVDTYEGLTIDYCKKIGSDFILRGLRNPADFEFEKAIAQTNRKMSKIETVFLLTSEALRSPWPGLIAAASFLTYWGFGLVAASGPEPKTPMVLFQALALWLTARRRWFWAGRSES